MTKRDVASDAGNPLSSLMFAMTEEELFVKRLHESKKTILN